MALLEEKTGVYVERLCCTVCDWYEGPHSYGRRDVCPKCGEPVDDFVGRYRYRVITKMFGLYSENQVLEFIKK